jgi:ABC-2 type transport system ATP-binding protein
MIRIENLHKSFGAFEALCGIDLEVKRGEIYGFIGQNGAGKSTTMNILAGLSRPSAGKCFVNGRDVSAVKHPSELHIGYLPEDPRFYPWLTAREILVYLAGSHKVGRIDNSRINEMLGWVGLDKAAGRRVGGFSRGMKQRLGICAAMVHDPQLLILDEPSSALDPEGRSEVLRLIVELKEMGKTIFFSTHILSDVERVSDTIGIIANGKMCLQKPLQDILRFNLQPVYDITLPASAAGQTAEKLRNVNGVIKTEFSGDLVSVTVADPDSSVSELLRLLSDEKIVIQTFVQRRHNLEDIFIQEVNGK